MFATVGPATTQHIGFEQFRAMSKIDVTYVPYPGGAPAMTALLGGHVHAVLTNYSEAVEQLHAGTVRALASASLKRILRCRTCRRSMSSATRATMSRSGSA